MKTADLIPLILIELKDEDKYGFELTKSIETKSQGKIVIKQPTLYTVLKKLEKSKFISSYWEDSEIGGKRHYYKITNNGLIQLETLPSYDVLINNILAEEDAEPEDSVEAKLVQSKQEEVLVEPIKQQEKNEGFSIFDVMDAKESTLPPEDVFSSNSVDNATELELNQQNASALKSETQNKDESFASNENVLEFTKKNLPEVNKPKIKSKQIEPDLTYSIPINNYADAKFIEYTDFRKTEKYKQDKIKTHNIMIKCLFTNLYLFAMIIVCSIIGNFVKLSPFYYVSLVFAILTIILYPAIAISYKYKLQQKIEENKYDPKFKLRWLIASTGTLIIAVIGVVICVVTNSSLIFANIIAPVIFTSCVFIDCMNLKLILKRKEK